MDKPLAQGALDEAFKDHVSKLFDVLCLGIISGDVKGSHQKFMGDFRLAHQAHAEAVREVTEAGL